MSLWDSQHWMRMPSAPAWVEHWMNRTPDHIVAHIPSSTCSIILNKIQGNLYSKKYGWDFDSLKSKNNWQHEIYQNHSNGNQLNTSSCVLYGQTSRFTLCTGSLQRLRAEEMAALVKCCPWDDGLGSLKPTWKPDLLKDILGPQMLRRWRIGWSLELTG